MNLMIRIIRLLTSWEKPPWNVCPRSVESAARATRSSVARPATDADGTMNLMMWECVIPGKEATLWEGGIYKLRMTFDADYLKASPKCRFEPPIFHPNVLESGEICSPLLVKDKAWRPNLTVEQILVSIQNQLDKPNLNNPVQEEALNKYKNKRLEYNLRVSAQARERGESSHFSESRQ
ncbi:hypothetical protein KR018_012018 [Drosophila ironensis]|nr:hypothetical protein KR018_012018 [Drosophila ironensis]